MNKRVWLFITSCSISFSVIFGLVILLAPKTEAAPLSIITVTTLVDGLATPGNCSLREAITAANNNAATDACPAGNDALTDTIIFDVSGTISLTGQLTVTGGGPMIIDGDNTITISGENHGRILTVVNGANVNLHGITLIKGFSSSTSGGGILNYGTLTVTNSAILNNRVFEGIGGGIANYGSLAIINSTLMNNNGIIPFACGGVANSGSLIVSNSSLSNNTTWEIGGGICNFQGGIAEIISCQFLGNYAEYTGGGIDNSGHLNCL